MTPSRARFIEKMSPNKRDVEIIDAIEKIGVNGGSGGSGNTTFVSFTSPNTPNPVLSEVFLSPAGAGTNLIVTVPIGKRVMISGGYLNNPTAGAITHSLSITIGGVNYRARQDLSAAAGSFGTLTDTLVLLGGESLNFITSAAGLAARYSLIEYDDSPTALNVSRMTSLAVGKNVLLTAPSATQVFGLGFSSTAMIYAVEQLGLTQNITPHLLANASAVASNSTRLALTQSLTPNALLALVQSPLRMTTGQMFDIESDQARSKFLGQMFYQSV